jgi:hypothetical protein
MSSQIQNVNSGRESGGNKALKRKPTDWRVLRIWEHELAKKNEARLLQRIQRTLG